MRSVERRQAHYESRALARLTLAPYFTVYGVNEFLGRKRPAP
jgi:hypothetical protein